MALAACQKEGGNNATRRKPDKQACAPSQAQPCQAQPAVQERAINEPLLVDTAKSLGWKWNDFL